MSAGRRRNKGWESETSAFSMQPQNGGVSSVSSARQQPQRAPVDLLLREKVATALNDLTYIKSSGDLLRKRPATALTRKPSSPRSMRSLTSVVASSSLASATPFDADNSRIRRLEDIVKKMYRKNVRLAETIARLGGQADLDEVNQNSDEESAADRSFVRSIAESKSSEQDEEEMNFVRARSMNNGGSMSARRTTSQDNNKEGGGEYDRRHLVFLLSQRDKSLAKATAEAQELRTRLTVLEKEKANMNPFTELYSSAASAEANNSANSSHVQLRTTFADEQFVQFEKLDTDFKRRIQHKVKQTLGNGPVSTEARAMVDQLTRHLVHQSVKRKIERGMSNQQLLEWEQKNCDLYVQNRLMEKKVAQLEQEMHSRGMY